ncbi:MAG: SDR family oxidoreductase [Chitinophagales bacterium]|nr:SDR family oxidoreductase [Chitinophagales bacterium]
MDLNLAGKHALVGGGSKGIGYAAAVELALLGASVTLMARNETDLQKAVESLDTRQGQQHGFLAVDMGQTDALQKQLSQLVAEKPIHILVNNTGGPPGGLAHEAALAEYLQAFTNHLLANQLLVQAVWPGMKAAGYGRIINVISTSVKQPLPNLGVSNTIRGAVANWAKTLANELGQYGITVNNILPGATSTDRLAAIVQNKSNKTGLSADILEAEMKAEIPARRFAEPKELGAAIAFLASPAAAYINGINLPVDGGRTGSL